MYNKERVEHRYKERGGVRIRERLRGQKYK